MGSLISCSFGWYTKVRAIDPLLERWYRTKSPTVKLWERFWNDVSFMIRTTGTIWRSLSSIVDTIQARGFWSMLIPGTTLADWDAHPESFDAGESPSEWQQIDFVSCLFCVYLCHAIATALWQSLVILIGHLLRKPPGRSNKDHALYILLYTAGDIPEDVLWHMTDITCALVLVAASDQTQRWWPPYVRPAP